MAQIKVSITKGNAEVSIKATDISSNTLPDLIASVKAAKTETNEILSGLVKQKSSHTGRQEEEDEDEGSDDENDEEKMNKKQKT